ncbi:7-carboxy-7-deazaguanine synthase QueE [Catenulispora rubra]|uniref:7-carboxy-7-deazaguanine synthase QueE n=1 Tax=Catenulispora rubra TaxID=280293 RepID=UPI002B26D6FA|nr:7-carboxy-7-deazaguanine synthase QueE [Catenulispora rubra]
MSAQAAQVAPVAPAARTLLVSEMFGPTVQGEGPSAGRRCGFLRLGGCNLHCSWCDTPYTWDWQGQSDTGIAYDAGAELTVVDVETVVASVLAMRVDLLVVTGGEPLRQQRRLLPVVDMLAREGVGIEVETNGTIEPHGDLVRPGVRFNVSPKLAHASDPLRRRIRPAALHALNHTPDVAFKFVCRDPGDLEEVAGLVAEFGLRPVWIMPEGRSPEVLQQRLTWLADAVVDRGWNLSTRLHVIAWGDKRGA